MIKQLSSFPFKFNLRHYIQVMVIPELNATVSSSTDATLKIVDSYDGKFKLRQSVNLHSKVGQHTG